MDDPSRGSKTLIMLLVLVGAGAVAYGGIYLVNNGIPGKGSRPRQIVRFETSLPKVVSQDPVVNISNCKPVPDVLSIKAGAKVMFINDDPEPHGLIFDAKHYYGVLPHSRTSLIFDFYPKPGVRSYICDGRDAVGLINILK